MDDDLGNTLNKNKYFNKEENLAKPFSSTTVCVQRPFTKHDSSVHDPNLIDEKPSSIKLDDKNSEFYLETDTFENKNQLFGKSNDKFGF